MKHETSSSRLVYLHQYKMTYLVFLLCCVLSLGQTFGQTQTTGQWVWKCDSVKGLCKRQSSSGDNKETYPTVELCRLVCGQSGGLWPVPTTSPVLSKTLQNFGSNNINYINNAPDDTSLEYLKHTQGYFEDIVSRVPTSNCPDQNTVDITVSVESPVGQLNWDTDETYKLDLTTQGSKSTVEIRAKTVFGARHGVETLIQLIEVLPDNNGKECLSMVKTANIQDGPVYPHRGLLLDCARNFLSVESILKHIDAMAGSKLNVLHWHVTDSQSFPLYLPSLPNMTKYGAYGSDRIYQVEDVQEIISYARFRGIRVVIEIDAPSHAGNGWQWGPEAGLGNLAICLNQQPWRSSCIQPPCGQLNPANQNVYSVLKTLYSDILSWLPSGEPFHMGGDEVFIDCWNSSQEILKYIGNKPRTMETFLNLWSEYQAKALDTFDKAAGNSNTKIVLWTSHLTNVSVIQNYLSKDRYVIQTWVPAQDTTPNDLLKLGYKIIVSTKDAWYLDHGFWGSTVYHGWRAVYNNKIPNKDDGALGGEVCMWGEYTDSNSVESKVWPRAAAAAERLWSNPTFGSNVAEVRFYRHRQRLVDRKVHADALVPFWCYQNEGQCD